MVFVYHCHFLSVCTYCTVQNVRLNRSERHCVCVCEGDKTETKNRSGERGREIKEYGPVSKMSLEGSPSSLHPAHPWSSTLRRINSIHVKLWIKACRWLWFGSWRLHARSSCTEFYTLLPSATVALPRCLIKSNIKHSPQMNNWI